MVCREAVQNIERNTLECRKACFEKVISSWASKNLDTILIALVTVGFE
jgi:hypothetical protein